MNHRGSLFKRIMSRLQDKKGNYEQKGIGPNSEGNDEDYGEETETGAQLENGMRSMRALKKKMEMDEANESPEDEANESDEYQDLEDEMGTEKHSAGSHLFPKGKGLQVMIAIAQARKGKNHG